jgi:hypothetical protein
MIHPRNIAWGKEGWLWAPAAGDSEIGEDIAVQFDVLLHEFPSDSSNDLFAMDESPT